MKKQFLTVLLLAISTFTFSQKFAVGIRGGLGKANMTMDAPPYYVNGGPNIDTKESRTNINAGIYGQYSLNEKMALQAELFYSNEGVSFTNPGTEMPADIKLNYLSFPVFFKYKIIKGIYAMAAPQISFLSSASCVYKDGYAYDVKNEHNKINLALVPAIGYDWKNLSINVRYQLGLSKVPSSTTYWSHTRYADGNVKSNVVSVVLSYKVFGF